MFPMGFLLVLRSNQAYARYQQVQNGAGLSLVHPAVIPCWIRIRPALNAHLFGLTRARLINVSGVTLALRRTRLVNEIQNKLQYTEGCTVPFRVYAPGGGRPWTTTCT
jgi:hypothetical protein